MLNLANENFGNFIWSWDNLQIQNDGLENQMCANKCNFVFCYILSLRPKGTLFFKGLVHPKNVHLHINFPPSGPSKHV